MGLLDGVLGGLLGGKSGGGGAGGDALLQSVIQMLGQGGGAGGGGGLSGLGKTFESGGLGDIFSSWVGTGDNQPITPDQLQRGLGQRNVEGLASGSGMSLTAMLPLLAQLLPVVIDKLTPQGQLPASGSSLQKALAGLLGPGDTGGPA